MASETNGGEMTPRKHAELIKAWADGAEMQRSVWMNDLGKCSWVDEPHPDWAVNEVYRIKPVPKADTVETLACYCTKGFVNVRITFDGETGEAKKVEIVK